MMKWIPIAIALVGCGPQISVSQSDAAIDSRTRPIDAPYTTFLVTSPVIAAGAPFQIDNTCDGSNVSPQLTWAGSPTAAASFAVTLSDKTIGQLQWAIYDIPATKNGLPTNVQAAYAPSNVTGAHQTMSYQPNKRGYRGPCPPLGDAAHAYEIAVYGLDVAVLPSVNTNTALAEAVTKIMQHQLDVATLSGTYTRAVVGPGQ